MESPECRKTVSLLFYMYHAFVHKWVFELKNYGSSLLKPVLICKKKVESCCSKGEWKVEYVCNSKHMTLKGTESTPCLALHEDRGLNYWLAKVEVYKRLVNRPDIVGCTVIYKYIIKTEKSCKFVQWDTKHYFFLIWVS